eukprot:m.80440 g.80440  ORF g.80440 m.80440 type:complete len:1055 (+) comp8042_c0_seq1:56-3220(+)
MAVPRILASLLLAGVATAAVQSIRSGVTHVAVDDTLGNFTLQIGAVVMPAAAPSVYFDHSWHTLDGDLRIASLTASNGTDEFGTYTALALACTAGPEQKSVVFSFRAYQVGASAPDRSDGVIVFEIAIPDGATGTQIVPPPPSLAGSSQRTPPQIAPFPAFSIDVPGLSGAGYACFHPDKDHLSVGKDVGNLGDCATLSAGPTILYWPKSTVLSGESSTELAAALFSFADNFKVSLQRISEPDVPATLYYNHNRDDYVFCTNTLCVDTQVASGYGALSHEGFAPSTGESGATVPLYFWWSPTKQTNYVTTNTTPPDPSYTSGPNPDGFIFSSPSSSRIAVELWANPTTGHTTAVASAAAKALLSSRGFSSVQTLGYIEGAHSDVQSQWVFGVSGELTSVPTGFRARSMVRVSLDGINDVVDGWGASMRHAYNTTKLADEDIFLAALSVFTDNGATTLGLGWPSAKPAPAGNYNQLNWDAVSLSVLSQIFRDVNATGIPARGLQLDAWWYPVASNVTRQFLCGSDWTLPPDYYDGGLNGTRLSLGVPMMLYLPAICPGEGPWLEGYTMLPPDPAVGFRIPSGDDSYRFFTDLFKYAQNQAQPIDEGRSLWPGIYVPPAVRAGWQAANGMGAYETDFFWNLMMQTPQMRSEYGAADKFLKGMADAAADQHLTVQVCAGEMVDWLTALTMPTVTQGRGSIDYAYDIGDAGPNGLHNWAAADGGWAFWAVRIAESKDNFWSSWRNFSGTGFSPDQPTAGNDCELHATNAILATGPVGLGDYIGMPNATLIQRLARADGILLRPDRPQAPMDAMLGAIVGARGVSNGARLWMTHATVGIADPNAPEVASAPTRRLVSHTGVDATLHTTVPGSFQANPDISVVLQWSVVAVDVPTSFPIYASDLYPRPGGLSRDRLGRVLLVRDWHAPGCVDGAALSNSSCFTEVVNDDYLSATLFDASTIGPDATTCVQCHHRFKHWVVYPSTGFPFETLLLGDLTKTVPLSGYRFRELDVPNSFVAVGAPGERVPVTYLVRDGTGVATIHVLTVVIGADGLQAFTLGA